MGLVVHVVGRQGCKAILSLLQFHLKLPTLALDTASQLKSRIVWSVLSQEVQIKVVYSVISYYMPEKTGHVPSSENDQTAMSCCCSDETMEHVHTGHQGRRYQLHCEQ